MQPNADWHGMYFDGREIRFRRRHIEAAKAAQLSKKRTQRGRNARRLQNSPLLHVIAGLQQLTRALTHTPNSPEDGDTCTFRKIGARGDLISSWRTCTPLRMCSNSRLRPGRVAIRRMFPRSAVPYVP